MAKKRTKIYMKEHPRYSGVFVTVDGKVISTIRGELKQRSCHGYPAVDIPGYRTTQTVHRLVAETFITNSNPEVFTQVDHINSIKHDNRVENLRWVTPSENVRKAKSLPNCNKNTQPVPVEQVDPKTNKIVNSFSSISEACRVTGAQNTCVNYCLKGLQRTAAGYIWRRTSLA